MIKLKDSRGQDSLTLGFVVLSWIAGTITFMLAAYKGEYFLAEYGMFVGTSLAPFMFREWQNKGNKTDDVLT